MTIEMCKVGNDIIRALIPHLEAEGWALRKVNDGGEYVRVKSVDEAIEVVDSVDSSTLYFTNAEMGDREWVAVIPGNGGDVICDYSICDEAFDKAMERFFESNSYMELYNHDDA